MSVTDDARSLGICAAEHPVGFLCELDVGHEGEHCAIVSARGASPRRVYNWADAWRRCDAGGKRGDGSRCIKKHGHDGAHMTQGGLAWDDVPARAGLRGMTLCLGPADEVAA